MLRKPLAGLAVCALTIAGALAIGSPAAADPPGEFTDGASFQEPDPCNTAVLMETTLKFHVKVHEHRKVRVLVADFTAETDTGYVGSGRETVVEGANHFADTQTAIVSNAYGDRYKVNFHITGTPNGIAVDRFSIRCVGGR